MTAEATTAARLSLPTLLLHWLVGFAVISMLAYGFWLQTVPSGPDKTPLVQLHKSFGLIVFMIALARLFWRWREGFPSPVTGHAAWERRAATTLHTFMIAATILMPVSGIVRSLAYARPVAVFGVSIIPKLFDAKQEILYAASANLHDALAILLCLAILLHVAAGIRHGLRRDDGTLGRIFGRQGSVDPSARR